MSKDDSCEGWWQLIGRGIFDRGSEEGIEK